MREHAKDRGRLDPQPASPGPPAPGIRPIKADVQAAVTVLARRPERAEAGPIDLRDTDFRGVRARSGRLGAILLGTRLDHADLGEVDLQGARLRAATLERAWLRAAKLQGASLRSANLRGAYLCEADLRNTDRKSAVVDDVQDDGAVWA